MNLFSTAVYSKMYYVTQIFDLKWQQCSYKLISFKKCQTYFFLLILLYAHLKKDILSFECQLSHKYKFALLEAKHINS